MVQAIKDNNSVNTMIGVLNTDGATVSLIKANPTSHFIDIKDGTTGSDFGDSNASKDDNRVSTLLAVSSLDGLTPIPLYVDSNGSLLINST